MIAAALFVAVAAQAASMSWGVQWGFSYDATRPIPVFDAGLWGSGTSGGTYWLIALGGSSDTSGISVDTAGVMSGATPMETGAFASAFNGEIAGLTTADNLKYYALVVFDSAMLNYGIATAQVKGISDTFPPDSVAFSNDGVRYDGDTPYLGMAANIAAVPEPTSMALLALGVAAIGLRRKLRK